MILLLQDGAVLCDVSDSSAVVVLHVTAAVPHHLLRGDVVACDHLSVERARNLVDVLTVVCTMCRMSFRPKPRLS